MFEKLQFQMTLIMINVNLFENLLLLYLHKETPLCDL